MRSEGYEKGARIIFCASVVNAERLMDGHVRKRLALEYEIAMIRAFGGDQIMSEQDAAEFVQRFEAAWSAKDGAAFLALWHPNGELHSPIYDRVIYGRELGLLNDLQKKSTPALQWALLSWAHRGDVVMVEWESSNTYGERTVSWRGVDKLTLRDGRIQEEVVYLDTAPLHAMRLGRSLEPLVHVPL